MEGLAAGRIARVVNKDTQCSICVACYVTYSSEDRVKLESLVMTHGEWMHGKGSRARDTNATLK